MFFPVTFSLESELIQFKDYYTRLNSSDDNVFILKPTSNSQGRGIALTVDPIHDISQLPSMDYVIQLYIPRPLLIDLKKFDLRIYVLITSIQPLTIFVHNEGLVRIASHRYENPTKKNIHDTQMHLTNYSINKNNANFIKSTGEEILNNANNSLNSSNTRLGSIGNKRDFTFLNEHINEVFNTIKYTIEATNGTSILSEYEISPCVELWRRIDKVIVLTIASALEKLQKGFISAIQSAGASARDNRICFELLGIDILLNDQMNPFVLEVNHSPSMITDSTLDTLIKEKVLSDTLNQINQYIPDVKNCTDLYYERHICSKQFTSVDSISSEDSLIQPKPLKINGRNQQNLV